MRDAGEGNAHALRGDVGGDDQARGVDVRGGGRGEEPTLDGDQRRGGLHARQEARGGEKPELEGLAAELDRRRRRDDACRDARGGGECSSGARARAIVTVQTTVEGRDVVFKRAEGRAARRAKDARRESNARTLDRHVRARDTTKRACARDVHCPPSGPRI